MLRFPGARAPSSPSSSGRPDPRGVRLLALAGAVAFLAAVPLAVASAGSLGDRSASTPDGRTDGSAPADAARPDAASADGDGEAVGGRSGDADASGDGSGAPAEDSASQLGRSSLLSGLSAAATARCGPELSSPEGVEAQTCVLTRGNGTWARTYYRNTTGEDLSAVLSLMAPRGHTVQLHCALDADDEPGVCETPRERTTAASEAYTAVAEFARAAGADGPMLLRSGSNSPSGAGS
ncbi:hypothetical protein GCM10010358_40770 [Streptomyces minutiscleroticus]|uniref:Uncharacterized protein n=1 Tax=Streptomyces minutiscleroticus TaxID=68238 RepID=A0A918U1U1_9ACTN|nr:hypothetical protein [Streptomyces minutiscleroticus]GGX82437.1 hypothetical protein GCM10010358_40770 [Streptomyces minutiscleroticus]